MISNKYKLYCTGLGLLAVLALYFTWCISTITYKGDIYNIIHLLCTVVTSIIYFAFVIVFRKCASDERNLYQIQVMNFAVLIFFALLAISDALVSNNSVLMFFSDLIWVITTIILCYIMPFDLKRVLKKIIEIVKCNYLIVLLLIVSVVLAICPTMFQFKWDGALYEQVCRNMNIHSMSSIAAYAHISQGYGVLFCLANMIVGNSQIAMAVVNIFMYICSICAFRGILSHIVPRCNRYTYFFATAVYAFSPFVLGMVNYYSLDYATLCLFVCMLYFTLKRHWILQFVAALFACFTKEPAIISYGALCLGIVIVDFVKNRKIKDIFLRPQYYLMAITGVLWLVTYKFLGGWSAGDGKFAIDVSYMLDKAKVLYVLNFNWIFFIVGIIGIFYIVIKKKCAIKLISWCLPLVVSTICFTIFSMVFKTVNHARYAAQVPAILYIIGIVVLLYIFKEYVVQWVLALLACLMLASSFVTVDPISWLCFDTVDVGDMKMITTGIIVPGDSMIYNKQMLGFEYALNQAIEYAVDNDYMVIMPTYEGTPNLFDGLMQDMKPQDYGYTANTYWSGIYSMRTIYEDVDTKTFMIYELNTDADILQLPLEENEKHCFIYSRLLGAEKALEIQEIFPSAVSMEYNAKGWDISVIVF